MDGGKLSSVLVSNVLNEEKKQQAEALGRLGWSLRQIEKAIRVCRETISIYLKAAGIAMRAPRGQYIPAKPASLNEVITDSGGESATTSEAKPDSQPGRSPSSSACLPYQDVIELGISRGAGVRRPQQPHHEEESFNYCEDSALELPGFTAFPPEWLALLPYGWSGLCGQRSVIDDRRRTPLRQRVHLRSPRRSAQVL